MHTLIQNASKIQKSIKNEVIEKYRIRAFAFTLIEGRLCAKGNVVVPQSSKAILDKTQITRTPLSPNDTEYLMTMISPYVLNPSLSQFGALFRTLQSRRFLLLCICLLPTFEIAKSQDYLYAGKTDFVIEFDPDTNPFVTQKAQPRVVEFYSPLCPACIAFSPHYKQMAKNTKKLYPEILFFGVSCDHHEDVCDAYGVEGYPTIRFFKAGDDSTSKGIEKEFEAEDARDEDTPEVIASLLNVKSRAGTSLQLPKGESGDNSGSDSSDEPENSKKSGLTNQLSRQRPGLNGFQTGLTRDERSQKYNSFFKTAREQQIQKRQGFGTKLGWKNNKGGQQGPSVVSFNDWTKGMKQNTPGTPEFLNRKQAFQKRVKKVRPEKLKLRPQQQDAEDGNKLPFSKDVRKPKWYQPKKLSPEEELIMDTTLSLVVSLETGLSMGITDITSKSAMKDWLNLLSASLPPEWNVHKLIKRIKANFDYATQSKENFKEIVGTYKLTREGWSPSCKNEALNSAGFTCGFWKLIHVITLGVAEERGGQNLIDSGDFAPTTKVFSPASAAITIRNYIDKFFTCKPCREHFLETFDECENNRRCERLTSDQTTDNPSDWKELAMYFWEFHNDVSVRLVGERIRNTYTHGVRNEPSARDEVAALFPSINDCISCFDDDGAWIKSEVFGFLERAYWPDSEKDPLTDKLLKFEGESDSRLWFLLVAMALTVGLILVLVHRVTGKQSYLIHQSLVTARQLVSTKLRTV